MKGKILMTGSAIVLASMGLSLSFMPNEISLFLDLGGATNLVLCLQLLGAVFFGFSLVNWMTRENLLGGIYGRPLVIGNLAHFSVSAIALVKVLWNIDNPSLELVMLTIVYTLLAIGFGTLINSTPTQVSS